MSALEGWREEKQSAWLYRQLIECERDPKKREMFAQLADAAEAQSRVWATQVGRHGEAVPTDFKPALRARLGARLAGLALVRQGPGAAAGGASGRRRITPDQAPPAHASTTTSRSNGS